MNDQFIPYLKSKHKGTWQTLLLAAADGLVVIDEDNDAVTATNRLLFTYPGLHEVLQCLTDTWAERHVNVDALFQGLIKSSRNG